MEEKQPGMFASIFSENGNGRRPTNLDSVIGADPDPLTNQEAREPTKSIYMPTHVNKKEIEKSFMK